MNNLLKILKRSDKFQMQEFANNLMPEKTALEFKTKLLVPVINSDFFTCNGLTISVNSVYLYEIDQLKFPDISVISQHDLGTANFKIDVLNDYFRIYTDAEFYEPNLNYNCFYYLEINLINHETLKSEIFKLIGEPEQDLTNLLVDYDFIQIIDYDNVEMLIQ